MTAAAALMAMRAIAKSDLPCLNGPSGGTRRAVLRALILNADTSRKGCDHHGRPRVPGHVVAGVEFLSAETGFHRTTIMRALDDLEGCGLVVLWADYSRRAGRAREYLVVDLADADALDEAQRRGGKRGARSAPVGRNAAPTDMTDDGSCGSQSRTNSESQSSTHSGSQSRTPTEGDLPEGDVTGSPSHPLTYNGRCRPRASAEDIEVGKDIIDWIEDDYPLCFEAGGVTPNRVRADVEVMALLGAAARKARPEHLAAVAAFTLRLPDVGIPLLRGVLLEGPISDDLTLSDEPTYGWSMPSLDDLARWHSAAIQVDPDHPDDQCTCGGYGSRQDSDTWSVVPCEYCSGYDDEDDDMGPLVITWDPSQGEPF